MSFFIFCFVTPRRICSDTPTSLSNGIHISEKLDASGAVSLNGGERGVFISGKVSSAGAIDITGRVEVVGSIKASGSVRIRSTAGESKEKSDGKRVVMMLGTKVEASSVSMEGDIEVR